MRKLSSGASAHAASNTKPSCISVEDFARDNGIGRSTVYLEIKSGRLKIVKVGKRTLIRNSDAETWRAALQAA
jgi:excisionase family DNA binding protein